METCRVVGIDSILSTGWGWEGGLVGGDRVKENME